MEQKESTSGMLDLMIQPAFTVRNGVIDQVNDGAKKYFLEAGMQIADLLLTGKVEYQQLQEGCLYLALNIAGQPCDASVRHMNGFDLFTVEQDADQAELQAMALAAQELRIPLSGVMTVADQLFPVANEDDDPDMKAQVARINRGLYQMLRIVSNMSDAYRYSQQTEPKLSVVNITDVVDEIFCQSAELLRHGGTELTLENLNQPVFTLADEEKLERAIHNIISNAAKFAGKGGAIHARLARKGNMLYLTVQDNGNGIGQELRGTVHSRFRRVPGLEDSRFGIGLGMVMIRAAASAHGGAVLIDHPEGCGTRITMSMTIRQDSEAVVRTSPLKIDYAGERNHALTELSEVLPNSLYESQKIN
jgi:signal transduction histidine kinase